jgi:hypothetical protein
MQGAGSEAPGLAIIIVDRRGRARRRTWRRRRAPVDPEAQSLRRFAGASMTTDVALSLASKKDLPTGGLFHRREWNPSDFPMILHDRDGPAPVILGCDVPLQVSDDLHGFSDRRVIVGKHDAFGIVDDIDRMDDEPVERHWDDRIDADRKACFGEIYP